MTISRIEQRLYHTKCGEFYFYIQHVSDEKKDIGNDMTVTFHPYWIIDVFDLHHRKMFTRKKEGKNLETPETEKVRSDFIKSVINEINNTSKEKEVKK